MDYPSGGRGHHHHAHRHHDHRDREEDGPEAYPPPSSHYRHEGPPPVARVEHTSHYSSHPPDLPYIGFTNPPPSHYSHPAPPSALHGYPHAHFLASHFSNKPIYRVYSKARPEYSLSIRDGQVILSPSDARDDFQHWYKDEKYSTRVKDEEGFPCFALVNKATGHSIKHSVGHTHPVQLIDYNPDVLDESVLWTLSRDLGDGYRTIRMVNNIRLNVDAFHGDKNHGGVHDGTTIVLWEWMKGENQRWMITPY